MIEGKKVYVLTNIEMGWDCVCGVFGSLKSLKNHFLELGEEDDEDLYKGMNFDTFEQLILEKYDAYVITTQRIQ